MRYLNRVFFINSANVKYAEIAIDGNVHFIGTQGVGKSTLCVAAAAVGAVVMVVMAFITVTFTLAVVVS